MSSFFGTRTITAAATAVSIDSLIRGTPAAGQAAAFTGTGIGCSMNFSASKDIYVGTASTVTDSTGGGLLSANTPFTDAGTGVGGNIVDPMLLYVYSAGSDATITVYFRSL